MAIFGGKKHTQLPTLQGALRQLERSPEELAGTIRKVSTPQQESIYNVVRDPTAELNMHDKIKELALRADVLPSQIASVQEQVHEIIEGHIQATGKVYRGLYFETTAKRDRFIKSVQKKGITEKSSKYEGIPLSALPYFAIDFVKYSSNSTNGVLLEIDAKQISYRQVDYTKEETPYSMIAAEVRTPYIPPSAITIIYNWDIIRKDNPILEILRPALL